MSVFATFFMPNKPIDTISIIAMFIYVICCKRGQQTERMPIGWLIEYLRVNKYCTVGPLCNIRCCEHISGKVLKTSNMLLGTFRGIKGTRIWYLLTSQAQGIDIIKAELLGGQEKRACFWPKTAFWKSPISQKVFNIFWWFFFCLVMGTLYCQKNHHN